MSSTLNSGSTSSTSAWSMASPSTAESRGHRHDPDLRGLPADRRHRGPDCPGAGGLVTTASHQLGVDATMGPGQDHRRRPGAASCPWFQHLSPAGRTAPREIEVARSGSTRGSTGSSADMVPLTTATPPPRAPSPASCSALTAPARLHYFDHDPIGVVLVRRGGYAVARVKGGRWSCTRSAPAMCSRARPPAAGRSSASPGAATIRPTSW
jgi:hypothetical protein